MIDIHSLRPPQDRTDCLRRRGPVRSQDVSVDVGGHADRGVSEDSTDHLEGNALCQHQARGRMAKFVHVPVPRPALLHSPLNSRNRFRGSSGVPTSDVNMNSAVTPSPPSASSSTLWNFRRVSRSSSIGAARLTLRRLIAVFVSTNTSPAFALWSCRVTRSTPSTSSRSVHLRPSASPLRRPVESIRA